MEEPAGWKRQVRGRGHKLDFDYDAIKPVLIFFLSLEHLYPALQPKRLLGPLTYNGNEAVLTCRLIINTNNNNRRHTREMGLGGKRKKQNSGINFLTVPKMTSWHS